MNFRPHGPEPCKKSMPKSKEILYFQQLTPTRGSLPGVAKQNVCCDSLSLPATRIFAGGQKLNEGGSGFRPFVAASQVSPKPGSARYPGIDAGPGMAPLTAAWTPRILEGEQELLLLTNGSGVDEFRVGQPLNTLLSVLSMNETRSWSGVRADWATARTSPLRVSPFIPVCRWQT